MSDVCVDFEGEPWYTISMNNEEEKNEDQLRQSIADKIAKKAGVAAKLDKKLDSLAETEVIYQSAIDKAQAKIDDLSRRIEGFAGSREGLLEEKATRLDELERMEELLRNYDELKAEGDTLGALMMEKINAHKWFPGDPPENRGALDRDAEYQTARKRLLEINSWTSDAMTYTNRIFYSRGDD